MAEVRHPEREPDPCAVAASAIDLNPWDDVNLVAHAACLSESGDLEGAAIIYSQMLAFEPNNVNAAMELAAIRIVQGDEEAARALFDLAASHATSDAEAAQARARAEELQRQH